MAARAWNKTQHELRKRATLLAQRRGVAALQDLLEQATAVTEAHVTVVGPDEYAKFEAEARRRISRDPDDWPTVAAALALEADIWTADGDFLNCEVATWTADTLMAKLAAS